MRKAVDLAKKIYKDPEANWLSHLEEQNLHKIFRPIYHHNFTIEIQNKIVSFIILAYDNDSHWINPKKDRYENKLQILDGIDIEKKSPVFKAILNYDDDKIQEVILQYLMAQTDHRWYEVMTLLEYSNKTMMFCNRRTNEKFQVGSSLNEDTKAVEVNFEFLDPREIAAVNKEKGDLIKKAMEARKTADELLRTMESDYQKTDHATQGDFGFAFSDPKKYDPMSWEQRLRKRRAEQSED